jgi:hypothetical protein
MMPVFLRLAATILEQERLRTTELSGEARGTDAEVQRARQTRPKKKRQRVRNMPWLIKPNSTLNGESP